jgi:two-component system sensor histidine kinase DegS
MKKIILWSEWSIATKILFLFLGLSVISMGITGYISIANIRNLGSYAEDTSASLGEQAINDSTVHLNRLGEDIIKQKSRDVAKQVEMYLAARPEMTIEQMRADQELRNIVVQPVGKTGYTTLIDPVEAIIIIHKFPGQEKNLDPLKSTLPTFWNLLKSSAETTASAGYYDWLEVDGSINQKYASIVSINTSYKSSLTLWATTYITEFSMPAEQTKEEINAAIRVSSDYINKNVTDTQDVFFIAFSLLVVTVIGLALLMSRVITSPIKDLMKGAEAVGKGNLDYQLNVKSKDELGDLADSFNKMASDLKSYTEQLENTAAENIQKEKKRQENLRFYMSKVVQAQEAERKRIARELHDDTIQSLVVIARKLDDLSAGNPQVNAAGIRDEVRQMIEVIRRFSQELRPSILDDLGLIPAVKWLVSDFEKNYKIIVETEITGTQRQLPPESELVMFRIIQESLTNIGKHSKATDVTIKIHFTDTHFKVIIQDNGTGFDVPQKMSDLARAGKLGLVGIRERAELLGGKFDIETRPGQGTTLIIEVPS